ncbi:MAG: hypothetical protein AVO38_10865 [delta proteobacterium ML8_D]|jgi:uncharacterized membrane protein|nr:MAG: hypothetical protein AVO38_10865 [delta proteobacterium ML8_D]
MSKKMQILVLSSLLLNVLLVGFLMGDLYHRFAGPDFVGRHDFIDRRSRDFVSKLTDEKATLFFETLEEVRLENHAAHKQIREAREQAMKILAAPFFDEAAYRAELKKLQQLRSQMKQRFADATIKLARQFGPEDRKLLAQHLRRAQKPFREDGPQRRGLGHPAVEGVQ